MDLAKINLNELIEKARRYEEIKALHAKRMMTYRKKNPIEYATRQSLLAKRTYWRKKGFEINDLGEKVPIAAAVVAPLSHIY